MRKILTPLIFLWTLPQNLLAIILILCWRMKFRSKYKGVYIFDGFFAEGVSLGYFILFDDCEKTVTETDIKHEYGHCIQSLMFGPLYLIVIGIFSELNYQFRLSNSYYEFWTEKWADKLGGVQR